MPSNEHSTSANLSAVGRRLLERVDELCLPTCRYIRAQIPAYRDETVVTDEELMAALRTQVSFVLSAVGSGFPDTEPASRVGRLRAQQGLPLADVMSAYRAGSQILWEQLAQAIDEAGLSREELRVAASNAWQNQSRYTDAMTEAYREVITEQLIRRDQERSMMVAGLIAGHLPAHITAWDAARLLGLPESGVFVVVAIDSAAPDFPPLHGTEQALAEQNFPSAWRLEPDMQVGIVAIGTTTADFAGLGHALVRHTTRHIGISPASEGHPLPGTALSYAKAALLAATDDDPIVIFDTNPYAVAATADRQIMDRYRTLVLGTLGELEPSARKLLVDTFLTWASCGGSITATARELFCHPNTIRYRLRQLKQHTGRDHTSPRDLAELHLAIEADRRLPHHAN